ncbi:transcription factor [Ganoderma sinense ZZ0214-1]|uniref:[histone H3]-trimethyl-L-lysine(9) demethylase n=1 Tax=Ganoderma sinense ZZ0214-1 TaxID=1077348 RepID=A0A2G8SFW5_9APHY|nr:transcription factor [Ganoderma sinense ZZ0214-1]
MATNSRGPSVAHLRAATPDTPLQPDHFYGNESIQLPPSPNSDGRDWLDPADDPTAQRGIPVFRPTLEEFQDFEGYMNRVEPWGMRSGIVKIIPPKEWTEQLPSVVPQLDKVKLKSPIEQHMLGQEGRYQQQNIEKRKALSLREWAELCATEDLRAPGVNEIGLYARANNGSARRTRRGRKAANINGSANGNADARMSETAEPEQIKREQDDDTIPLHPHPSSSALISPPHSNRNLSPTDHDEAAVEALVELESASGSSKSSGRRHPLAQEEEEDGEDESTKQHKDEEVEDAKDVKPRRGRRAPQTRETKEAELAVRAEKDRDFLDSFEPHKAWLPPGTEPSSYTHDFCKDLERRYWRNCGFGKPPWYGADMQGSLFTDETTAWNVACLPSALTRLLPASSKGLPGVNTPYLYFGMWRATFAWHVEDMDLFSINYIHFGAPKFWYAMPQARANALEQTMKGLFPGAGKNCDQFLRHKSYLASPTLLAKTSCRPNYLVQQSGEFVITFPRGYHAGFNLGFNCAESVNFALESWIDIGRRAKACGCVNFSVRIDVDQLLRDRAAENRQVYRKPGKSHLIKDEPTDDLEPGPSTKAKEAKSKTSRKRKPDSEPSVTKAKKQKTKSSSASPEPVASSSKVTLASPAKQIKRVMLKMGPPPPPKEQEFPCCLCPSDDKQGLLRVHDPPAWWYDAATTDAKLGPCMAHEECAAVVPETWVDEIQPEGEMGTLGESALRLEKVVFGVDAVSKDRWNLKCTACTKLKNRAHGAKIQCVSPRCLKAFHVSCARDGHANGVVYRVLREVEKEVILVDNQPPRRQPTPPPPPPAPGILILHPDHQPRPPTPAGPSGVAAGDHPMDVDPVHTSSAPTEDPPEPRVLKSIRKTEVELLCHQHNPATLAKKKEANEKRIRDRVVNIPEGSLIKLRITNGIFEVQLLRIVEERRTVEVLWDADKDLKKEFSWKSVLVGNTEGIVAQKPSDVAPKPSPAPAVSRPTVIVPSAPYPTSAYRSLASASSPATSATHAAPPPTTSSPAQAPPPMYASYYQQPRTATYSYGSWTYPYSASPPTYASASGQPSSSSYAAPPYPQHHYNHYPYANTATQPPYPHYPQYTGYNGYAPPPPPNAQSLPQLSAQQDARQKALLWQTPYTGPKEPVPKPPPLTVPVVPSNPNGYGPVVTPVTSAAGSQGPVENGSVVEQVSSAVPQASQTAPVEAHESSAPVTTTDAPAAPAVAASMSS